MIGLLSLWTGAVWAAPPPVVNGEETSDFLPVGTLVISYNQQDFTFCSGTLIEPDQVLTAAHCVAYALEYQDKGYTIHFLTGSDINQGTTGSSEVVALYSHPDYNANTLVYDLGIASLKEPMEDAGIYPITADTPSSAWEGEGLQIVGFGLTSSTATDAGIKRTVELPVDNVDAHFIWLYDTETGKNACSGDSGGAALRALEGGGYELVGAISFVYNTSSSAHPCDQGGTGVSRLDISQDWINGVLAQAIDPDVPGDVPGDTEEEESEDTAAPEIVTGFQDEDTSGCAALPGSLRGGLGLTLLLLCSRRARAR